MSEQDNANPKPASNPFAGPQLQNSEFKAADMTATNFDGVNLTRAKFYAVLEDAQFNDCNLSSVVFKNVNLSGAQFDDVNLANSIFHNINLSGTKFDSLSMRDVEVTRVDITGMKIDGIPVADFIAAYDEKHGLKPETDGASA
ncbi:MAG: pentapeptide repeat-containing protein [Pseudomonadota bacterium]